MQIKEIQSALQKPTHTPMVLTFKSVMAQTHAVDARPIMRSACLARERRLTTRCIQKGIRSQHHRWIQLILISYRYVEMLEQQQSQLVSGLRELYRRVQVGEGWSGKPLKEAHDGYPLTHDILDRLNVLHWSNDSPIKHQGFEDDLEVLQQRCLKTDAAASMTRRAMSEESEPGLTSSESSSSPAQSISFPESFSHKTTPPTPAMDTDDVRTYSHKSQYTMPSTHQISTFNPMPAALLQQAWAAQQMPTDQAMDLDMYSFNPSSGYDPQLFSNLNPFQTQEAMAMGWPDSFDQLINPSALQT